jgi:precorrin-6A/cobalt-precorrin-6A reductase
MDNQLLAGESGEVMAHNILILGGTTEARALAEAVATRADISATVSLAGRTTQPRAYAVPMRIGGFGGPAGLADWLRTQHITALIDATHPYAAAMSANAAGAAAMTGVPLLALRRPAWTPVPGDRWTEIANVAEAVAALGQAPRRVFLALGRQELRPFEAAPLHDYLIRSVDPVDPPLALPRARYLLGRGPFDEVVEAAMLAANHVDAIVAKNSGGTATYGKIAAARALGIEVLLLRRPILPEVAEVATVRAVLDWLDGVCGGCP